MTPTDTTGSAPGTPSADAESSAAGSSAGETVPVGADGRGATRAKRARADESGCAICMQPLTARLTLDGCEHDSFCRECIEHWGRHVANTCPLCRSRFSVVTERREGSHTVATAIPHREGPEPDYEFLESIEDTGCERCGGSHDEATLLLCDGCDCCWHLACLRPPLRSVPEGEWFCEKCDPLGMVTARPPPTAERRATPGAASGGSSLRCTWWTP